jgi:hypothetical protein
MVALIAFAAIASTPQEAPVPVAPAMQATATVRIVSAVRLKFDGTLSPDVPTATITIVHTEGNPEPARLIEFQ